MPNGTEVVAQVTDDEEIMRVDLIVDFHTLTALEAARLWALSREIFFLKNCEVMHMYNHDGKTLAVVAKSTIDKLPCLGG